MGKQAQDIRMRFLKILLVYLAILIALQMIGIVYIFQEPSLHKGIPLAIFLGTILPIILALIITRFIKIA